MFGLSKKERAAETVRRGVLASLTGAYFHHSNVEQLGLTKQAASWLYTEALAHQFYSLWGIFSHALSSTEQWATEEFFAAAAERACGEHEAKNRLAPGALMSFVFPRFSAFQAFSEQQRHAGEHYALSSSEVRAKDPTANAAVIETLLRESTERFVVDARRMFGV